MTVSQFFTTWNGKRTDYDGLYGFQCVDLIKQYLHDCYGMSPGAWGNAIDYWTRTHPAILEKFDKVQGTPQKGDIIVYGAPYGTFNGIVYGHIAIATSSSQMLEQNGGSGYGDGLGSNAIRTRSILSGKLGLLRPKGASVAKDTTIHRVFEMGLFRKADSGALSTYRKTTDEVLINSVYTSAERKSKLSALGVSGYDVPRRISTLMAENKTLSGKLESLKGAAEDQQKKIDALNKALEEQTKRVEEISGENFELQNQLNECKEQGSCNCSTFLDAIKCWLENRRK